MRTSFPTKNLFTNWKMNTETLPDGYVEVCKKILGGIENE